MASIKNILYWLIANSVGGYNRGLILNALFKEPQNAHGLSQNLEIDYNTIRYHLNILEKNKLIEIVGEGYGQTYFITDDLNNNKQYFYKIWSKIKREEK